MILMSSVYQHVLYMCMSAWYALAVNAAVLSVKQNCMCTCNY
jgi:hypothetical protein